MKDKGSKIAENECWTDIIDVKNIDESNIDFVYSNSIERLKSSFDASSIIDNKNLVLLVFTVIVLGSLIKYLFSQTYLDISLIFLAIINIIGLFFSAVILILNSMTVDYPPLGQEPKYIFTQKVMNATLKSIKSGQILNLQRRIDEAIEINERKAKKLNVAFLVIVCSMFLSLIPLIVKILFYPAW